MDGGLTRTVHLRDGVAHLDLARGLDATDDVAHITRAQFVLRLEVHLQHPNLIRVVGNTRVEELHPVALLEAAVEDAEVGDDAAEAVEDAVEDECL